MIGGFIIRGALRKEVVLRALGPSLTQAGVQGVWLIPPVISSQRTDEVIAFLGAHFSGVPTPTPTPVPPPAEGVAQLLNVSTRAHVGSGDR